MSKTLMDLVLKATSESLVGCRPRVLAPSEEDEKRRDRKIDIVCELQRVWMSGWGSAGVALADGQGDGDRSSRVTLEDPSEKKSRKKKEFASVRTSGLR